MKLGTHAQQCRFPRSADPIQELQQEKDAVLTQVQKLQNQQAVNTGQLQQTAANVQNSANTSATQQRQLSTSDSRQLDNITKILHPNFTRVDEDLKKSFGN